MQEVRKQKKVFSRFQIDIKYLTDIPESEIWRWNIISLYILSLPGIIKPVLSILLIATKNHLLLQLCLSTTCSSSLQNYGINPQTIIIQTDNGKEFINPTDRKVTLFEK